MGDDITIGVTEIVNNIEVTAQPNDQIVDISVIDNADEVTLNITPTVIEINVNKGSSYARWGTIYGNLTDQTDLTNALILKADLVDGKVPAYQLPSFVDDVVEVANYAALPAMGEIGKIYVTLDNNKIYRWSGSIYIEIAANNAIWGAITGTLSNQTDLQNALNLKANDNAVVHLTGNETISGKKSFTDNGSSSSIYCNVTSTNGVGISIDTSSTNGSGIYSTNTSSGIGIESYNTVAGAGIYSTNSGNGMGIGSYNSSTGKGIYSYNLNNGKGIESDNVGNGIGISSYNITGTGIYSTNTGTGTGFYSNNSNTGTGISSNNSAGGTGISSSNSSTGNGINSLNNGTGIGIGSTNNSTGSGIYSINQSTGKGINSINSSTGIGIYSSNTVNTGVGIRSDNTSNGQAVYINNTSNGQGIFSNNTGSGIGIYSTNDSTGKNLVLNNTTAATGMPFTVSKNGTDKFTINDAGGVYAAGSVGIGTASPSEKLQVLGNIRLTGNNLTTANTVSSEINNYNGSSNQFKSSSIKFLTGSFVDQGHITFNTSIGGVDQERLRIAETGNVGIGTPSPSSNGSLTVVMPDGTNATGIVIKARNTGGIASQSSLVFERSTGVINSQIISDTGTNFLSFNHNGSERMRITSDGNVGIGTTSPGTASANTILGFVNGSNIQARTSVPQIAISSNIDGDWYAPTYKTSNFASQIFIDGNGGTIGIRTAASGTAGGAITWNNGLRMDSSGNVGIGTTSPLSTLVVQKNVSGGRGGELSIVNYATAVVGAESALNFGVEASTYNANDCNFQIKAYLNNVNGATDAIFSNWSGSAFLERMRITSGGNVTIGDSSTSNTGKFNYASPGVGAYNGVLELYHSTSNISGSGFMNFYVNSSVIGSIGQLGTTAVVYNTTSDYRLKEDLKPIKGLEIVSKIKVYDYKWKSEDFRMDGVLAHELQEVLPYAVTGEKDGEQMQSVDYSKLVPILVQAIQELKAEIEILKNK